MFIYLPNFADEVREITNRNFFIHNSVFTDSEKEKGLLERVVSESVMTMFYFDKWNKNGKKLASFLDSNAQKEDFEVLNNNIARLENIVTEETKSLFNNKNTFIWFTLFNQFTKLGLDDNKFAGFSKCFCKWYVETNQLMGNYLIRLTRLEVQRINQLSLINYIFLKHL